MSNTMNSIAGAVLASVLGAMGLGVASDTLLSPHYPEKPGYAPEVDLTVAAGPAAAADGPHDFGTLFADPVRLQELTARGAKVAGQCSSCHKFAAAEGNSTGPNLADVFGRPAGAHAGFAYSDAMKAYGRPWSYDNLDRYLKSPSAEVRGNRMAFAGIRRDEDRFAMIAYLRSLAPSPAPLPPPIAAPAGAVGAPAGEAAPAPG
jgi:cytochrome c